MHQLDMHGIQTEQIEVIQVNTGKITFSFVLLN